MAVLAKNPGYKGEDKDSVDKFHGNQLLYIGWDDHRMFCAPFALPLPPAMPFGDLIDKVLPTTSFTAHPDWTQIDWNKVEWLHGGQPFTPDRAKSLADNGLVHKSALRFKTPGLKGLGGSRN